MQDVYVIDARRTPFGSFGGSLAGVPAPQLAATVLADLLQRTGLPADQVEEVILGQVLQGGNGQAPARQAMRAAGIPDSAHAMTINKVCGSGLKAIMLGADAIRLGQADVALAGGMESMSLAPFVLPTARFGQRMGHATALDLMLHDGLLDPYSGKHMGEITEKWIVDNQITREQQDRFAARSYQLAQKAVNEGRFKAEIAPVTIKGRKGETVVDTDEEPFRGKVDKLPGLRPVFAKDGSITAGNASTINDGAAALLLASEEAVKRHGLKPMARLVAQATHSMHPELFGSAPVGAIKRCAELAGIGIDQIDLFEINEAFAAVTLVAIKDLELDEDKVNVNGGACAVGHPIGASGARLAATVIHELHVRQARFGLATLCIGGGEAVACIFERC
ncbi:acetyl-CoA C-acetyltransferase [Geothermobacter ehrlichii]|uniref:Acetyl-CoA C-acetyltransferase n=1 Tax=Geothermobacter ehrlichii TaxID=213224 RepID=A0A5D3WI74_9BACT|nr:acetyl-CoA C-acetyltransferase [Geothermobacter ehrlichii]TYO98585.1 acetyl-CoA C-acetyltransferase [Geothermobacter ehrlichii]